MFGYMDEKKMKNGEEKIRNQSDLKTHIHSFSHQLSGDYISLALYSHHIRWILKFKTFYEKCVYRNEVLIIKRMMRWKCNKKVKVHGHLCEWNKSD